MKKAVYAITTVIELLLLIGAWAVNYFTKHKMGMSRFVLYKNQSWERDLPLENLKILSIVLLILLAAAVAVLAVRKIRALPPAAVIECIIMLLLAGFSLYFTAFNSRETLRAYYFISPMIALSALLQIVKTGALLFSQRK